MVHRRTQRRRGGEGISQRSSALLMLKGRPTPGFKSAEGVGTGLPTLTETRQAQLREKELRQLSESGIVRAVSPSFTPPTSPRETGGLKRKTRRGKKRSKKTRKSRR